MMGSSWRGIPISRLTWAQEQEMRDEIMGAFMEEEKVREAEQPVDRLILYVDEQNNILKQLTTKSNPPSVGWEFYMVSGNYVLTRRRVTRVNELPLLSAAQYDPLNGERAGRQKVEPIVVVETVMVGGQSDEA